MSPLIQLSTLLSGLLAAPWAGIAVAIVGGSMMALLTWLLGRGLTHRA